MLGKNIKNIEIGKKLGLLDLTSVINGGIESRTLTQLNRFTMTVFAFDKGEGISDYVMPGESFIYVYEGTVKIIIEEKNEFLVSEGEVVLVPSDTLHSIDALEECKLMILIIKE
ncbi:MAG: cupin domain-containing protein [Alkaliphilus sp.]